MQVFDYLKVPYQATYITTLHFYCSHSYFIEQRSLSIVAESIYSINHFTYLNIEHGRYGKASTQCYGTLLIIC